MNVAVYARVSKADKDDPTSVPVQLADCMDRAEEEGWTVVDTYREEGVSAWNPKRKRLEYERMLADIRAGRVNAILVREQERLLRQMTDAIELADLAESGQLRLIACTLEGDLVLSRARDRKDFRDRASSAQFYSDFLSEKIRRTHRRKAEAGEWKGGGSRPFAFDIIGPKPYRVLVNEAEAIALRTAAEQVLAGRSLRSICREWNAVGLTTSTGRAWTGPRLRQVLTSAHIAGLRERDGGTVLAGMPALVDEDTWRALKTLLEDPARKRFAAPRIRRHYLVGVARCAMCGTKLTAHPNYHGVRTYICRTGYDGTGCGRLRIKADPFEEFVGRQVYARWSTDQETATTATRVEADPMLMTELHAVEAKIAALEEDYYANGLVTPAGYARSRGKLDTQRAELRGRVATETVAVRSRRTFLRNLPDVPPTWTEAVADPTFVEWHNELARSYIDRVEVSKATRLGYAARTFDPGRVHIVWRHDALSA